MKPDFISRTKPIAAPKGAPTAYGPVFAEGTAP
jgi:hypothetical protein